MSELTLRSVKDRKSTRLNSSHTVIYTLSLHDALPICGDAENSGRGFRELVRGAGTKQVLKIHERAHLAIGERSEEHTSELQSHRDLHSFPTRRSSDLRRRRELRSWFPRARARCGHEAGAENP